jgi:hypothetical protein
MAFCCSILFFVVLIVVGVAAVWAVWSVVAVFVANDKLLAIMAGLPVSFIVVIALLGFQAWRMTWPSYVFEQEFGFPAPADTTLISGSAFAMGDTGTAEIHFVTTPVTLARINGGVPPNIGAPGPDGTVSIQLPSRRQFAGEERTITFNPTTGEARYKFTGVD